MAKNFDDIEMDFQRNLAAALETVADDVTHYDIDGWKADAMVLKTFTYNLCLICHTAGIPWKDVEEAIRQTWDHTEESGRRLREEREALLDRLEAELKKVDEEKAEQLDLPMDDKKEVN